MAATAVGTFTPSITLRYLHPRLLTSVGLRSFVSNSLFLIPNRVLIRSRTLQSARKIQVRAARTESVGVTMGSRAPHFELPEPLTGKTWTLDEFESYPAFLVMFICNHCPFVIHLKKDIVKLAKLYMEKGLAVVAISSNSTRTHPQDGPEFMAEEAKQYNYPFPYLYDESQDVARAFGAVCTPDFFLYKKDGRRPFELFYHGQFDDSRPSSNVPVTGRDLSRAIECALSCQPLSLVQKPRKLLQFPPTSPDILEDHFISAVHLRGIFLGPIKSTFHVSNNRFGNK